MLNVLYFLLALIGAIALVGAAIFVIWYTLHQLWGIDLFSLQARLQARWNVRKDLKALKYSSDDYFDAEIKKLLDTSDS